MCTLDSTDTFLGCAHRYYCYCTGEMNDSCIHQRHALLWMFKCLRRRHINPGIATHLVSCVIAAITSDNQSVPTTQYYENSRI